MFLQISDFIVVVTFLAASSAAPKQSKQDVGSAFSIPNECKGQRYCSVKPEGYDELEEMMNSVLPEFLIKNYADRTEESSWQKITNMEDNCPYITKKDPMYHYYHDENQTNIDIIVQTKFFKQFVESVNCLFELPYINVSANVQCMTAVGLKHFSMESTCKPVTANRTLYVYDPEKKEIITKGFEVPASCYCSVSHK